MRPTTPTSWPTCSGGCGPRTPRNTGAVRIYERHGFVVVGGTDNEEGAPDLRMEWRPPSLSADFGR